jgi:hypothetical protein
MLNCCGHWNRRSGNTWQIQPPSAPDPGKNHETQGTVRRSSDQGWAGRGLSLMAGAAVAVGTTVAALSAAARPVVYEGTTYYQDGGNYYKQCYEGDEAAY